MLVPPFYRTAEQLDAAGPRRTPSSPLFRRSRTEVRVAPKAGESGARRGPSLSLRLPTAPLRTAEQLAAAEASGTPSSCLFFTSRTEVRFGEKAQESGTPEVSSLSLRLPTAPLFMPLHSENGRTTWHIMPRTEKILVKTPRPVAQPPVSCQAQAGTHRITLFPCHAPIGLAT